MLSLALRRTAFSLFSLVVVSLVLFMLTRSIPTSPARIVLGDQATDQQIVQFDRDHGLDRPVLAQYGTWLRRLVFRGDLGQSFTTGRDMNRQIGNTLPVTMEIVALAFLAATLVSIVLGTLSALYRDSIIDYAARLIAVLGVSVPGFWLALVLILFFAVDREWFPPGGVVPFGQSPLAHLRSIALPCFCLGCFYLAVLTRMTRHSFMLHRGVDTRPAARACFNRRFPSGIKRERGEGR